VGTNVHAVAITQPYFYILDKFEVNLFMRLRVALALDNPFAEIARTLSAFAAELKDREVSGTYKVPKFDELVSQSPRHIDLFVETATNDPRYADATEMSASDFQSLSKDPFRKTTKVLKFLSSDTIAIKFVLYEADFFLFGTPRIELTAASEGPQYCIGDDAITLRVKTSVEKAKIPLLNGVKEGLWFANFDGKLFQENTPWTLGADRTNLDFVTLRLPRSTITKEGFSNFGLQSGARVYLRATPEVFPFPKYNMFATARLSDLFSSVLSFQCCDDTDCSRLYGMPNSGRCTAQKICQRLIPTPVTTPVAAPIAAPVAAPNAIPVAAPKAAPVAAPVAGPPAGAPSSSGMPRIVCRLRLFPNTRTSHSCLKNATSSLGTGPLEIGTAMKIKNNTLCPSLISLDVLIPAFSTHRTACD
jgi:hypothetical protein